MSLITPESFAVWSGFQPGLEFLASPFEPSEPNPWYGRIPEGTQTKVAPVIPVFHEGEPDADYWKSEVSTPEWASVSPLWIATARALLRHDPYFEPYRSSWFVDQGGNWTKQFREHELFGILATELGARMRETLDFGRTLIGAVNNPGPHPLADPGSGESAAPEAVENLAAGLWGRLASWAHDSFTLAKLFTPEGLGWTVAWEAASWGVHRYENYRQQREKERQKHRPSHRRLTIDLAKDLDLDFEASWAQVAPIPSFAAPEFAYQGLFVTKAPVETYDWMQAVGGPQVLVSHDGVYK